IELASSVCFLNAASAFADYVSASRVKKEHVGNKFIGSKCSLESHYRTQ
ncbi:unnamed protein product, partial [Larinioides sclopetarius]